MRSLVLTLATSLSLAASLGAQELRVYFIDVDQAEATLLVSPSGNTLLVDSGKNGHGSRLQAAMASAGVNEIDHFVATHYHEDHYGGIDDLVRSGVTVSTAYDRGDKQFVDADRLTSDTYIEYDTLLGHRAEHLTRGETIPLDTAMTVTVVSSGGVVLSEPDPTEHGGDENDMSIGLWITYGDFHMWVGGDVEEPTEQKIADRDLVTDFDVYQANHHGAENGSTEDFLKDLSPSVIVISNGSHGSYDHPRLSTLARMQGLSPAPTIYQLNKYLGSDTDIAGNVDDEFISDPETDDTDGTISMTVDSDDGAYVVSYGTRADTFDIKERSTGTVVIEALLPDPTNAPDRIAETVTLRNDTGSPVEMDGWVLRDAGGRVWALTSLGTISAGASATIQRNAMPMSLNNSGAETIELVDPGGEVVDSFSYNGSERDIVIQTGH